MDITGLGALAEAASSIVGKFFPDKTQQEKDQLTLQMQSVMNEFNLVKSQTDINEAEAKNINWFVAGWRPFVGWICGLGVAYQFLIYPLAKSFYSEMVALDSSSLLSLLTGMLGLGAMRTVEKYTGSEGNR